MRLLSLRLERQSLGPLLLQTIVEHIASDDLSFYFYLENTASFLTVIMWTLVT